jgi:hypothetical protein
MENGPKTGMSTRQPKPAGSFAARPKRWTPSSARPQLHGSQSAQRSYERYLALAQRKPGRGMSSGRGTTTNTPNYFRLMSSNRGAT